MEKDDLNNLILSDEALETVSGGVKSDSNVYPCPYCRTIHKMTRYAPWTVKYNNNAYRDQEKFYCEVDGIFYVITDESGNKHYFDRNLQPLPYK